MAHRRLALAAVALSALLAAALGVRGQTGEPRSPVASTPPAEADGPRASGGGAQSHRVVKVFDFEERAQGNFENMPRYWFSVTGPAYPRHTADQTGFDTAVAHSGSHSLRMKLDGGSASLVLQTGALAAIPGADYIIIAHVQTKNIVHSRARISGLFVDQHGRAIESSASTGDLIASNGHWTTVKFRLNGDHPNATWIVLRLELLQEEEFVKSTLAKHELYRQDLDATAWFDDVAIYQLPRLDLTTANAVNIIRAPDVPQFNVLVHDLTGEKLTSVVRLYDHLGNRVDTHLRILSGRQAPAWVWKPAIARFGWYWAELDVQGDSGLIGRRTTAFLYLPEQTPLSLNQSQRFGLIAENIHGSVRPLLPQIIRSVGTGSVVLDVWNASTTSADLDNIRLQPDPVIDELLKRRLMVSLSLAGVPAPLAEQAKADADKPWSLLAGDPKLWRDDLHATLVRYGQQVHRWQIGAATGDELFWKPASAAGYPAMSDWFATMAPRAQIITPWPAQFMQRTGFPASRYIMLNVTPAISPDQIAHYLALDPASHRAVDVMLQPLGLRDFDHAQREQDMALRLIETWASRSPPRTVYLNSPWINADARHPAIIPDPVLGVYACTIDRLAGRRVVAELPIQPGIRCLILEADDGSNAPGALALWLEQADLPQIPVAMYLGEKPQIVDIFGNRAPLQVRDGLHQFVVSPIPSFIEGIDSKLIRFRAALRFDPAVLESSYKLHSLSLGIANPWTHPITGRLRLTGLPGWEIRPRVIPFTVEPNGATVVPVAITFPISETAGEKRITGVVELESDRNYQIAVSIPLHIGLKDIELHTSLTLEAPIASSPIAGQGDSAAPGSARDIMVHMLVTNRSNRPKSLYAFATPKDRPRQERIIADLAPGQTILKKFRISDAAPLSGTQLRVGLRQMDGPAMINQLLDVP